MNLSQQILKTPLSKKNNMGLKVFEALSSMSESDMIEISKSIVKLYPSSNYVQKHPAMSHTPSALFIRHLFGSLHKNGTLIDLAHPDRKDCYEYNMSICTKWSRSFVFCSHLDEEFKNINNDYGRVILYEVIAHRYGDLAFAFPEKREAHLENMEFYYLQSYKLAREIKCVKQYFTPWYWGACYFSKCGKVDKAIEWHKEFHKQADRMNARSSFVNKVKLSFKLLKGHLGKDEFVKYIRALSKSTKSKAIKKALKK